MTDSARIVSLLIELDAYKSRTRLAENRWRYWRSETLALLEKNATLQTKINHLYAEDCKMNSRAHFIDAWNRAGHVFQLDEHGEPDWFAMFIDYHNGPVCEHCDYTEMRQCNE